MVEIKFLKLFVVLMMVFLWCISVIYAQNTDNILAVYGSYNGRLLAETTFSNKIQIRDRNTNNILHVLMGHSNMINDLAWNSTDTEIVSVGSDGNINIWNVTSGQLLHTFTGQSGDLQATEWFNNDAQIITTSVGDGNSEFRVWDAATGVVILSWKRGSFLNLALNSDRTRLAYGSLRGSVFQLNSALSDIVLPETLDNVDPAYQLAWNPTDTLIASGHLDGQILIWDANTGHILNSLEGATQISIDPEYTHMIRALAFDPSGNTLRSINGEGLIRIWETQTWTLIAESHVPVPVYGAEWSKDGNTVWYGSNSPDPVVYTVPVISTATPTSTTSMARVQ